MAGSYYHIVSDDGRFIGTKHIENLGDAFEALEECYGMIQLLSDRDPDRIEWARRNYKDGLDAGSGWTAEMMQP